jgi:zinc transport system substrate-binding protein
MIVMSPRSLAALASAFALLLATAGCSGTSSGNSAGKSEVVAAFYPLQFVAEQVGREHVTVQNLVKPDAEPHDIELTPRQITAVGKADFVVYLRNFQPQIDEAIDANAKDKSLDAASVRPLRDGFVPLEEGEFHEDEKGKDPHIWLDPTHLAAIADAVAKKLADADSDHADAYTANAKELRGKLEALDSEYKSALAKCQQKTFIVSHNAFGYLADRYGLKQASIAGLTPETEPSAAKLNALAKFARANGIKVIFFETLVSDKTAKTLANTVGAKTDVLDPIEGLSEGTSDDYFSVMRKNLTKLRSALGCS